MIGSLFFCFAFGWCATATALARPQAHELDAGTFTSFAVNTDGDTRAALFTGYSYRLRDTLQTSFVSELVTDFDLVNLAFFGGLTLNFLGSAGDIRRAYFLQPLIGLVVFPSIGPVTEHDAAFAWQLNVGKRVPVFGDFAWRPLLRVSRIEHSGLGDLTFTIIPVAFAFFF